jgi:hypothetical protein
MADISMCSGEKVINEELVICNKREKCYRFTAIPNPHWQSYLLAPFTSDDECSHYWDNIEYAPNLQER